MKTLHLICKRSGVSHEGMTCDKSTKLHRSEAWKLSPEIANELIGGRILFHESKQQPSTMGGKVVKFETTIDPERLAFFFESESECRNVSWRGQDHGMAWAGGIVDV